MNERHHHWNKQSLDDFHPKETKMIGEDSRFGLFLLVHLALLLGAPLAHSLPPDNPTKLSGVGVSSVKGSRSDLISGFDFMSESQIADVQAGTADKDVTSPLQAAVNSARALRNPALYLPYGTYSIDRITVSSKLLIISDGATLMGNKRGSFNAILDLTDCSNCSVNGKLFINGRHNAGYSYGVLVATSSERKKAQYNNLQNIFVSAVATAFGFGSEAFPAAIVSENTLIASQTYDTPNAIRAYGTNTFVNVLGSTLDSTVSTSWGSAQLPAQYSVYSKGAKVLIVGGEVLHTTRPMNGSALCLDAISKNGVNSYYGGIYISNSDIETAAPLLTTLNSSSLEKPVGGEMSLIGNVGWNGNNTFPYVKTGADFTGRVIMRGNNFSAGAKRIVPNVSIGNVSCVVDIDDASFGRNYMRGQSGIRGGTTKFVSKAIVDVGDVGGQLLAGNEATAIIYRRSVDMGNSERFFSDYYNVGSGVFTVPPGGLEDVKVNVMFRADVNPAAGSTLGVFVNGVAEYQIDFAGTVKMTTISAAFSKLNGGDVVEIRFYNNGHGAVGLPAGAKYNRLVITGSS